MEDWRSELVKSVEQAQGPRVKSPGLGLRIPGFVLWSAGCEGEATGGARAEEIAVTDTLLLQNDPFDRSRQTRGRVDETPGENSAATIHAQFEVFGALFRVKHIGSRNVDLNEGPDFNIVLEHVAAAHGRYGVGERQHVYNR